MSLEFNLNEDVIIDSRLKKFLQFRSNNYEYKFRILLNYLICNCFMEEYDNNHNIIKFNINKDFKNFLKRCNKYYGSDYSMEGIKKLLSLFVNKKEFVIEI
jgi:hypothetical protein